MPFEKVGMWAEQRLVVVGEGALHYGVEVCVAAAEEEVPADAALDVGLHALGAKGFRVDVQLVGAVILAESRFELPAARPG